VRAHRARDTTRARARFVLSYKVKKSLKSEKKSTYFVKKRVFELHSFLYENIKGLSLVRQVIFLKMSRIIDFLPSI